MMDSLMMFGRFFDEGHEEKKKRSLSLNFMAIGKVSFTNVDEFSF